MNKFANNQAVSQTQSKLLKSVFGLLTVIILTFLPITSLIDTEITYINDDLSNLRHLNSNVQRLVKLSLLNQEVNMLQDYIEGEVGSLLNVNSPKSIRIIQQNIITLDNKSLETSADMVATWDLLKTALSNKNRDSYELYLISDNYHYKSMELTTIIENRIELFNRYELLFNLILNITSLILIILSFDTLLKVKTELEYTKSLNIFDTLDVSTGLYNRSQCQELFNGNLKINTEIQNAIVVFDLNDLKQTNDKYGHNFGDELISSFANLLQQASTLHKEKPFLCRFGGDEFVVFYDELEDKAEITQFLAELKKLSKKFNTRKEEYQISYAVGVAINTVDNELSIKTLFDKADESMYQNKLKIKAAIKNNKTVDEVSDFEDDDISITEFALPISKEQIEETTQASYKNNKRMVLAFICVIISVVGIGYVSNNISTNYIDNNTLYLSDGTTNLPEDKRIRSPWKASSTVTMLIYRSLFMTDSTLHEVNPSLASSYKKLDDGLTYEITLKSNEYWSDGTKITPEDVIFSIETFLLAEGVNTNILEAFNKIVGVDDFIKGKTDSLEGLSTNGNTITIKLDSNYSLFMQMLTQFVPLPQHILKDVDPSTITTEIDYYKQPISSGMYVVDGLNSDGNIVLSQNSYYDDQKPNIESVVFISDYTPLDIDYYSTNVISNIVNYRSIRGYDEHQVNVHFYRYFIYNIEGAADTQEENPMSDYRIREALMYAIDREYLLDILYFNTGNVMAEMDTEGNRVTSFGYNPTKARNLLVEADYDFERPITIAYYYSDSTSLLFLEKVKEYLENIGLEVILTKLGSSSEMYDERNYDLMLKGLSSFSENDWYNEYLSNNPNLSKVFGENIEFDTIVNELFSIADVHSGEHELVLKDLIELEKKSLYKMPLFSLNQYVYIDSTKVEVPDDIVFGNTTYRSNIRFEEWKIKKE